jgi:hypothetical protein
MGAFMRRILLCTALAAVSLGLAATAYGQGRPRIILYQDDDYRGPQLSIDGDTDRVEPMNFNDRASSVRVLSGIWELCEHDGFGGRCITVSRDEPSLRNFNFNDTLSSVRSLDRRAGAGGNSQGGGIGGGLLLYEDINYGGPSRTLGGVQRSLSGMGWNDRISSIQVRFGVWEICQHDDFGGRCIQIDRDVPNLVSIGFNDEISSIRRIR